MMGSVARLLMNLDYVLRKLAGQCVDRLAPLKRFPTANLIVLYQLGKVAAWTLLLNPEVGLQRLHRRGPSQLIFFLEKACDGNEA